MIYLYEFRRALNLFVFLRSRPINYLLLDYYEYIELI